MSAKLLVMLGLGLGVQFAVPSIAVSAIASDLSQIQAQGRLVVAVKDNWYPLGFRDDQGTLQGFEVDLARQLALELLGDENAVELRPVANQDRLAAVVEREADIAIAGVTLTAARQRVVSFSLPYYLDGTGLITRNPQVQALGDLRRRRVAVLDGSSAIAPLRQRLPQAQLVGVESYQAALALLEQGEADAFAGDGSLLAGWSQVNDDYRLLPTLISADPLAIVLPKGTRYTSLRQSIDHILRGWHDSGWLAERANHWGLP